jgi:hypothetical protein
MEHSKFSFSTQNLFFLSILQHVIASKSNHINTMLPNEMVLATLQKLRIKYELSYQFITRLKYILKTNNPFFALGTSIL